MIRLSNMAAGVALGLIVTSTFSLAASRVPPGHNARAQAVEQSLSGDVTVSPNRARAFHECNDRAGKLTEYLWGVRQTEVYRACLAEHGEAE